jgi:glucoamylase
MEQFAVGIGLIPEQVWDRDAIPDKLLRFGGPTGSAIPLVWAHAEYIKLVRSVADHRVFDCIEPVRARYATGTRRARDTIAIWSLKQPVESIPAGRRLRVIAGAPFTLCWTANAWVDRNDTVATPTRLGVWFVDVPTESATRLTFTFFYPIDDRWAPGEHTVAIR